MSSSPPGRTWPDDRRWALDFCATSKGRPSARDLGDFRRARGLPSNTTIEGKGSVNGQRTRYVAGSAVMSSAFVMGAMSSSAEPAYASAQSITINAILPPGGNINDPANAGLLSLTKSYEKAHRNVTVQWLPYVWGSNVTELSDIQIEATGGDAPDMIGNQNMGPAPPRAWSRT
jgi:hypothetical protein